MNNWNKWIKWSNFFSEIVIPEWWLRNKPSSGNTPSFEKTNNGTSYLKIIGFELAPPNKCDPKKQLMR